MAAITRHEAERIAQDAMTTDTPSRIYPGGTTPGAGAAVTSGGSVYGLGSWVELVPANTITADYAVKTMYADNTVAARDVWVELGIGGAGSEVVYWRGRWKHDAAFFETIVLNPPLLVPANARVAVRTACSTATSACTVSIEVSEGPL